MPGKMKNAEEIEETGRISTVLNHPTAEESQKESTIAIVGKGFFPER